jgi:hypothetical protein
MKIYVFVLAIGISLSIHAKEWKSLKHYQKTTHETTLSPSDWLASDRRQNTLIWQHANVYNLTNDRPQEYETIKQYRDFYAWINYEFKVKGHHVVWQKMAYFISCKLRLLETFPHCIFTSGQVKRYADRGSEEVFSNAFGGLRTLFDSDKILKNNEALQWDEMMLHDEQFIWVERIYKKIDNKSLKQIRNMASGKFLYAFAVPKALKFESDISNPEERYRYALNILRPYCIAHLK